MPARRDWGWAVLIGCALVVMMDCRPAWAARRFIQRESQSGFYQAYAGRRYISGELITPGGGADVDPTALPVVDRRLVIEAERTGWAGNKAEFVVRHRIELAAGPNGSDASQEVHVQLKREGGRWTYTLFEVRGHGVLPDPNVGNPWARALLEWQQDAQPPG